MAQRGAQYNLRQGRASSRSHWLAGSWHRPRAGEGPQQVGLRPLSWLGWAGGPSSPLRPFPEHPRRQTVSPAHLGNETLHSRRGRWGETGEGFQTPPPHQTQDGGFSGLNPLSQHAPSHPPGLTDQASHLTGSLGSAPPAASSFCTPPSLASPGIRERRSAQMHLLQAQPRRAAVLMACCLLVSPSDPTP